MGKNIQVIKKRGSGNQQVEAGAIQESRRDACSNMKMGSYINQCVAGVKHSYLALGIYYWNAEF